MRVLDLALAELYVAGFTAPELADLAGVGVSSVYRSLGRVGVSRRRRGPPSTLLEDPAKLARLAELANEKCDVVALEIGCHRATVGRWLVQWGVR